MKMQRGKFEGLQRLSNDKGVIAALAIDQRGSMKKMIQKVKGDSYHIEQVKIFKEAVSRELTPYVSAILLDLETGEYGIKAKDDRAGLLLSYEKTGYDAAEPGRLPDVIEDLSALRIKEQGGDAVKILVYYDPDEPTEINEIKHAFLERIGAECRAVDIPLFVEPIVYDQFVEDTKSIEFAKIKPAKVKASIREFSKPRYGIDVLKVEVPVNFNYVEGFGDGEYAYTREEAASHFKEASDLATLPFIYLSAGVTSELFRKTIEFAIEAESAFCGVLCGRATWFDGVAAFGEGEEEGLRQWLQTQGKYNIDHLNELLDKASPWWSIYGKIEDIQIID
ncbi:tagatose 1,6-diphosphate aldolase [Brevibacillus laterosporus]|uniref:tagatose 1,6-diphosphate aldolase n=1 Tax=Brevibacillus laterosporus TaxID=1465 RepID=UPI0026530A6D|nr:tagatose 1,6-diphosphate aldolase [Brevibacillus laterosporus]MDN9009489.1 tagatose 1,6-diphosphate aldolase [Brevibacillus laterosporus]MDO0940512.1 tagatose 1,6-diphosphate aldolase [Brevibacillus laterosporus]